MKMFELHDYCYSSKWVIKLLFGYGKLPPLWVTV